MISMFTRIAVGERSTLESIATPCSVKTQGRYRGPPRPSFEVTNCDLKSVSSCAVRRNAKSFGKRSRLRPTAWFRTFVGTAYSSDKSESSITRCPRTIYIFRSMRSTAINSDRFFGAITASKSKPHALRSQIVTSKRRPFSPNHFLEKTSDEVPKLARPHRSWVSLIQHLVQIHQLMEEGHGDLLFRPLEK